MNQKLSELDPGDKSTDVGDERRRRHDALCALRHALVEEERVIRQAAASTEAAASTAMWLGASLADLATVTGKSRQAARKRWPSLGVVHRRRLWLGNHVDEIRWAVRVVLENQADIVVVDRGVFDELASLDARVGRDFDETAVQGTVDAAERWHILDRVVTSVLRGLVESAETTSGQAEYAVFGAKGIVGYYDHASEG
ncbi:hypothetical protein [Rhodococcus sovatensis]|uniref:Uncharacterized protein n=1 Tax=Rhodococcus sovatensis TaxID=1805840 RepID=A0ABZ2PHY3_9NOCA